MIIPDNDRITVASGRGSCKGCYAPIPAGEPLFITQGGEYEVRYCKACAKKILTARIKKANKLLEAL